MMMKRISVAMWTLEHHRQMALMMKSSAMIR